MRASYHRGLALLFLALALAGCGLGQGEQREGGAELRVTRDFGRRMLASERLDRLRRDQTVMQFLRSRRRVETRYGGRFVQGIDGLAGKGTGGRLDWFYFVNGIEAGVGAADYELSPGDVVQWDYRRWDVAMRVPAIVGAYPEPFLHGLGGRRFPVRVECAPGSSTACAEVKRRLRSAGVAATGASLGASGGGKVIRVVVGPWRRIRVVGALRVLEQPVERSGVFARFRGGGRSLSLLDEDGREHQAASGTGLVAAVSPSPEEIVWAVSGTAESGVKRAAVALRAAPLRNAYAVAAGPSGAQRLPLERR